MGLTHDAGDLDAAGVELDDEEDVEADEAGGRERRGLREDLVERVAGEDALAPCLKLLSVSPSEPLSDMVGQRAEPLA